MSCPETIEIDGTKYVKESAQEKVTGDRYIAVLDRGWIFVGNLEMGNNYKHYFSNVYNIRKWSKNGFGGMVSDPKAAGAVLDKSRDFEFKNPLFLIPVPEGWGK